MRSLLSNNLTGAQYDRLAYFGVTQSVDVHCHCLPGLDDGPVTIANALTLCRTLVDDGITTIIATPHQLGRYEGRNKSSDIRTIVTSFNKIIENTGMHLIIVPGADVRIDERIGHLLDVDQILTLADGGRYFLLELPGESFIDPEPLITELASRGIGVIISHPERNSFLTGQGRRVARWVKQGAHLQVTASSLVGDFGPAVERTAWQWLRIGAVSLVATDAHNTNTRRPRMSDAIDAITARMGESIARRVCIDNPLCVVTGQDIEPARAVAEGQASR